MAQISQNQLAKLFQRLATSYHAGIDLRSSVKRESQTGSPAYQQKMKRVAKSLDGGGSLAKALANTDGYFPQLVVSVVKAGEAGGRLDDSFARLGKHYKDLVTFRNNFLRAIAWPAFELVFAIGIVGLLMAICDWIFEGFEKPKIDWFWMGSTVGNVIAYYVLGGVVFYDGWPVDRGNNARLVRYKAVKFGDEDTVDRHHDSLPRVVTFCLDDVGRG